MCKKNIAASISCAEVSCLKSWDVCITTVLAVFYHFFDCMFPKVINSIFNVEQRLSTTGFILIFFECFTRKYGLATFFTVKINIICIEVYLPFTRPSLYKIYCQNSILMYKYIDVECSYSSVYRIHQVMVDSLWAHYFFFILRFNIISLAIGSETPKASPSIERPTVQEPFYSVMLIMFYSVYNCEHSQSRRCLYKKK